MGSGLCRSTDGKPRTARVNGLYRQIVFNYAKQWTRSNKRPKREKRNTKHKKRNKPTISGPFPIDPDRLEGDKWRYVILTRLDTEPPPERPPRTKRRRRQQQQDGAAAAAAAADGRSGVCGLWDSMRRRPRRPASHARERPPSPPRPRRRRAVAACRRTARRPLRSAAELMGLVASAALRAHLPASLPASLPSILPPSWPTADGDGTDRERTGAAARGNASPPPLAQRKAAAEGTADARRNGLFASVGRVTAMTDGLLSSR